MPGTSRVISGDSHIDLNPDFWTHRIPAKWQEYAPRVVTLADGNEAVQIKDGRPWPVGFLMHAGVAKEENHRQIGTFANAVGAGSPEQRLREQDVDGVDAEIMFSAVGNMNVFRQIKDDEGYCAVIRAYNAYLAEEYAAAAPKRLIPLGIIPTCGIDAAVAELEACANAGLKGVQIDKYPNGSGRPFPEDDRFWAASLDLRMPISYHCGQGVTRMTGPNEQTFSYKEGSVGEGFPDPMRTWYFRFAGEGVCAPIQMAFAGVWDRFPDLQLYWGETMIGWLPYALVQVDANYDRYRHMSEEMYGVGPLKRRPSDYIRDNNLWGFLSEPFGVRMRHDIGVDKVLWGSDFPHAAGDWPHSMETVDEDFAGVPQEERDLMLGGNAARFFHLDD
jgi:predicted TIM-barrel fold metal-dependent hydrolase